LGAIGPIQWGRSLRFAEVNGAKVIVTTDLPESILTALASLVDAVQQEFGEKMTERLAEEEANPRATCRWHPGQLRDYCGPCRSEQIAAKDVDDEPCMCGTEFTCLARDHQC
jgi:hypothetical protein